MNPNSPFESENCWLALPCLQFLCFLSQCESPFPISSPLHWLHPIYSWIWTAIYTNALSIKILVYGFFFFTILCVFFILFSKRNAKYKSEKVLFIFALMLLTISSTIYGPVCSEWNFSLTNEYPNIFTIANLSRMNVPIYSVVYIFTNECPNIFIHFEYSRINVKIN